MTIDLETLDVVGSKKNLPVILSIGAVAFDPNVYIKPDQIITQDMAGELLHEDNTVLDYEHRIDELNTSVQLFYTPVSLGESMMNGFTHSSDTLKWWNKQSYNMLAISAAHREKLVDTFVRLAQWLKKVKPSKVWANSPSFDCAILREAFDHVGLKFDFYFRDERDIRTARDFAELKETTRKSPEYYVAHHALYDAAWEAWVVQAMYERKRFVESEMKELTRLRALEVEMKQAVARCKNKDFDAPIASSCMTTGG